MQLIDSPSLASEERAYLGLRDMLLAGDIEPGQRLNEVKLAERLGMSRTPIRWALIELEHIGLISSLASGGFIAKRFSLTEVENAMVLRGCLEGSAARLAAERGVPAALAREFRDLLAQGAQLVGGEAISPEQQLGFARLNEQFHTVLARAAGNDALMRAIDNNNRLPFSAPSAMLPVNDGSPDSLFWLRNSQAQHEALVDAILGRQSSRAQHLAEEHARVAQRGLRRFIETPEKLTRLWPGLAKTQLADSTHHPSSKEAS